MNRDNRQKILVFRNFLSDLKSDHGPPTKEIQESYIKVILQTIDKKLKIEISAKKNSKNIENLEDLASTVYEIGEIETVEQIPGNNGEDYRIVLSINPEKSGLKLIEILKQKISFYEKLCKAPREEALGLTEFDKYLGKWNSSDISLKENVGRDLSELYPVLEQRLKVSPEEVYSYSKSKNIPAARAIIGFFLKNKYNQLSLPAIGKIMNKHHATVIMGINKFNGLILDQKIYTNVEMFFNESIKHYKGKRICPQLTESN